jgi:hypothetical protein
MIGSWMQKRPARGSWPFFVGWGWSRDVKQRMFAVWPRRLACMHATGGFAATPARHIRAKTDLPSTQATTIHASVTLSARRF